MPINWQVNEMCEKMIRRLIYIKIGLLMIYTLQWYFEMLCPSLIISKETASINVRKLNHMGRGRGTTLGGGEVPPEENTPQK